MQTTKLITHGKHLNKFCNLSLQPTARCVSTSHSRFKSFKIQDPEDFDERVKKSKTPVIVDFFAT